VKNTRRLLRAKAEGGVKDEEVEEIKDYKAPGPSALALS
jgi:hypothetical protein